MTMQSLLLAIDRMSAFIGKLFAEVNEKEASVELAADYARSRMVRMRARVGSSRAGRRTISRLPPRPSPRCPAKDSGAKSAAKRSSTP